MAAGKRPNHPHPSAMTGTQRGAARCTAAAILFGISTPAISLLTGDMNPFTLAGLLYIGAAIAVTPVALRHRPTRDALQAATAKLTVAVIAGGLVGPVLLVAALGLVQPATVSLLGNLELVFTVMLAAALFKEHLGRRVVTGTIAVAAGSALLGWGGTPAVTWGALLVAAACLSWAIDNSATATIDQISPSMITLIKGAIAGGINLTIGLIADGGAPSAAATGAALAIGAVGYGASITLWVAGARDLGAARGQLVFATAPFIGAVAAWLALSDPVTGRELAAFALAAIGVFFVLGSSHEHPHGHEPTDHTHDHTHDDGHHTHGHDPQHEANNNPAGGQARRQLRHSHRHTHQATSHTHRHVPDLHHRHRH